MRIIETTVDLHASPETVWETLVDFESYPEWNPFVTSIEGRPVEGERLAIRIEPPEGRAMSFKPRVTAAVPQKHFEWLGKLGLKGLFDGRHEFRIEEIGPEHTRLTHRESFSGLLVGLLLNEADIRAGFEGMNEALRERVEGEAAASLDNVGPVADTDAGDEATAD